MNFYPKFVVSKLNYNKIKGYEADSILRVNVELLKNNPNVIRVFITYHGVSIINLNFYLNWFLDKG